MPLVSRTVRLAIVDSVPEDYADLLSATGTPGISLHFLFSGYDALNLARRFQMSSWIVNSRLCDMSGFELAHKLRARRPNASVFIIGDEYRPADEVQTKTQGLTKYLCKPLEPSWVLPPEDDSCIPLSAAHGPVAMRHSESGTGKTTGDFIVANPLKIRAATHYLERAILPFENSSKRRPAA